MIYAVYNLHPGLLVWRQDGGKEQTTHKNNQSEIMHHAPPTDRKSCLQHKHMQIHLSDFINAGNL